MRDVLVTENIAGEELDALKKYQPCPYGLSPLAISLPYYQRAVVMQKQGQRHLQVSRSVVDCRPALTPVG